jgi:branched-chain amino acid transport system permease protein
MIQEQNLPAAEVAAPQGAARLRWSAGPWARVDWLMVGTALLVAALAPLVLTRVTGGGFVAHLMITFFIWSIITQCWNLIMGVSGIYSFGQVALYAIGGWTTALLAKEFGWSPWLSLWLAPIAATLAALVIGLPTLRLRGVYVVLLTLAFHELLRNFLTNGPQIVTGGGTGMVNVPKLFDQFLGGGMDQAMHYWLALALFTITTLAVWAILHSPIGVAFRALRDSEVYAVSRGVDPFRFKLLLFAFSAFFTGLAGGFMVHYQATASQSVLSFGFVINLLAMIVIGGWGSFWGPIVGTALMIVLSELLRGVDDYRNFMIGLIMALIVIFAPQGLVPLVSKFVGDIMRTLREAE